MHLPNELKTYILVELPVLGSSDRMWGRRVSRLSPICASDPTTASLLPASRLHMTHTHTTDIDANRQHVYFDISLQAKIATHASDRMPFRGCSRRGPVGPLHPRIAPRTTGVDHSVYITKLYFNISNI